MKKKIKKIKQNRKKEDSEKLVSEIGIAVNKNICSNLVHYEYCIVYDIHN